MGYTKLDISYPETLTLQHAGKTYRVKPDGYFGRIKVEGRYRNQEIQGETLGELKRDMEREDAVVKAKRDRVQKLAAAAEDPVPAMLRGNGGEYVTVGFRGVDKRSGNALILMPNGDRSNVAPTHLLRVLTETEQGEIEDALDLWKAAQETVPKTIDASDVVEAVLTEVLGKQEGSYNTIPAVYDAEADEIVVTFRGKEYRGDRAESIIRDVEADIVWDAGYRFALELSDEGLFELVRNDKKLWTRLFKTEEEGLVYIEAKAIERETRSNFNKVYASFRFDIPEDES